MDVQDKVTIITGASGGIGLAAARRYAQAGAKLVLAARSADKLEQLAQELRQQGCEVLVVPTDMRSRVEVERLIETAFKHFGRIDILVNNAGQSVVGRVAEVDPDHFRQVIDLNLFGPLYAMQAVVPKMRQAGGGLIINISSRVSKMHIPGLAAYASTKAALNLLSETARDELADENIRVITVYPRMTATDFGKNALGNTQMRQHQRAGQPGVVVDTPEHVADRILQAVEQEPAEQYME